MVTLWQLTQPLLPFGLKQGSDIEFEVVLMGFEHHANATQHGFHIHQEGNLGHKCNDSLGHYNPDNVNHGGPEDAVRLVTAR